MSKFKTRTTAQVVIIFLITAMLAEITLRIYDHFNPTFFLQDRSYNRFRGRPHAPDYDFNLNSRGFKDAEFKPKKDANTYRVLALGDSFAFGVVPYQHNYLTLLEQQLNGSGRPLEVLNMGIPGIGPRHYLALFEIEGLQLQPDMVLVSFFVGNDLTDTSGTGWNNFYETFAVGALVKYLIVLNRQHQRGVIHGRASYHDSAPTFTEEAYLNIEKNRSLIYRRRGQSTQDFTDAVGYLVRIKELCDSKNIALSVVIIPDELQVNPALQSRVIKALNVGTDELDFALPNKFLREQLQVRRIGYLDLLDNFLSASAQIDLYKPNDSHWNIAGNQLAADVLTRYLSGQLSR